jgi:hypothetical protein
MVPSLVFFFLLAFTNLTLNAVRYFQKIRILLIREHI